MDGCYYHADTLGLQSVAFPLFRTGNGGFDRRVCLDTMFRVIWTRGRCAPTSEPERERGSGV
ncbi:MAG: hypothetical protein C0501_05605 [Isosphaera sp.]|nr:hypothetical protein [Isosphaera sp.]